MSSLLEAEALGRAPVRPFSLRLASGELLGISGPSGIGKTTLLKMLADLIPPQEGRVLYRGESIAALVPQEYRRCVTYVSQVPFIFPGSAIENVTVSSGYASVSGEEREAYEKAGEFLEIAGLEERLWKSDASRLSVGEQARVALARALVVGPDVLLLDEPTASLDRALAGKVIARVGEYARREGRGAIIASHDESMLAACDRVRVMS